ncbi:SusD/RagB family nutrient-binding outer membrane lipoprotein [Siphonobacter sp. BAB-5405]|uniref:SusD/RagB family nutrient-binding outer membrane lipoprotein n=1 Tax=Siphonobacter sp. BAB-5405 TaxID=1864825 RepID=UPI000C804CB7|nr:SusD/RagB family nutrient-binding outer membrane lipoprotein [Siphonobacter sp. BAB-5405]PMD98694.1 SusD/RagB family nutrient-binding outer membrane lipoprotein [Siphonobacter sp. BAB-5405]
MNVFKTIHKSAWVSVLSLALLSSCDKGFEELNTNPDASPFIQPGYMFTKAQMDVFSNSYYSTGVLAAGGSMQHYATYKDVPGIGDKYYFQQGSYPYDYFQNAYPTAVNEITEVIRAVSGNPAQVNLLSVARIWRVYTMHRITDLYGDIPYSEAGKGLTDNLYTPKYDAQQAIYADMLKELEEAAAAFNTSQATMGTADLIYNGDITKWKKLAYSLMLRLSMRMTKVDAATAQTWAKKAIAGGVITTDADVARINYVANGQNFNWNPYAAALRGADLSTSSFGQNNTEGGKFAKTFIDHLKTTQDPRLGVLSVVWRNEGTTATPKYVADTSRTIQKGMTNGLLAKPADFGTYSEPNPNVLLKYDTPVIVISAAEVNLLLAEAAVRGWYTGEDAATAYAKGVTSAMKNWTLFGAAGVITDNQIKGYLAANTFPTSGTTEAKLDAINTQLWVSLYPDEQEVWANYRRSGYPKLTPVNVPGNATGGTIPRRLLYPPTEESVNSTQVNIAIQRQGRNELTTRMWWDKQ